MRLAIGECIDGRYEICGLLGEGGMAVVHRAISDDVSRTLVVKRIRPELRIIVMLFSRIGPSVSHHPSASRRR